MNIINWFGGGRKEEVALHGSNFLRLLQSLPSCWKDVNIRFLILDNSLSALRQIKRRSDLHLCITLHIDSLPYFHVGFWNIQ